MKILVFSFSHIGDAVLSTAVIEPLRRRFQGCEIFFLVGPAAMEIIEGDKSIDGFIVYDKRETHRGLVGKFRLVQALRQEHFDLVVDLRDSLWSRFTGSKRWGLRIRGRGRGKPIHAVTRYLEALKAHGLEVDGASPSLSLSESERKFASDFLAQHGIKINELLIGLHPGGGWEYKLWNANKFAQLADELIEKFKAKVLLFAGPKEESLQQHIMGLMSHRPIAIRVSNLRYLAALLECCKLYIGNDSGPMHIATAVKTPVTSLFGSTDYRRSGPYGSDNKVILSGVNLGCNPCHPGKHPGGCQAGYCIVINIISVDQVMQAVEARMYS
jgi:ADP-heptose:LPS heptosyltransferase